MDRSTKGRAVAFKTEEKEKFMCSSGVISKMKTTAKETSKIANTT